MNHSRAVLALAAGMLLIVAPGCSGGGEESSLGTMVDEATAEASETAAEAGEAVEAATEEAADYAEETADDMEAAAGDAMDDAAAQVDVLKSELAAREAELAEVTEQIKALSPQDLMTDKGKALKSKSDSLMARIEELKGQM